MSERFTPTPHFQQYLIVIKGAGDLASGVAYRLKRAGFPLLMTELPAPLFVRRTVAFGEAVYSGEIVIEGLPARRVSSSAEAQQMAYSTAIPVLVDPAATVVTELQPTILIDAIIAKRNLGTRLDDAPLVIALGPGFTAGVDCHVVIETKRGHRLGRPIEQGAAEADTGIPDLVNGIGTDRVLRAPTAGQVQPLVKIGDQVYNGQAVAQIGGITLYAPFAGTVRGLIHPSVTVTPGMKIGDLDPRDVVEHCFTISDKAFAIGGGVLEAILASAIMR